MKTFSALFLLLVSSSLYGQEQISIPLHSDNGMFFIIQEDSLVAVDHLPDSKIFGDLSTDRKDEERIKKVPTSTLTVFGLYPGMTIQSINFETGNKLTYTLGKDFFALLRFKWGYGEPDKEIPTWNRYNVLLSDNPAVHKSNLKKITDTDASRGPWWSTGFAYAGKELVLKEGKQDKIPLNAIGKNDPFFKAFKVSNGEKEFKRVVINGHELIINHDSYGYLALKSGSKYYFLSRYNNSDFLTDNKNFVVLGNWIKDAKTLFFEEDDCFHLMIFSKEKVSKVDFECKGR